MRTLAKAAAAAVTAALLAVAPTAAAADHNPELIQSADQIMALSSDEFATADRTPPFDWSSDGCSVPGGMAPYIKVFKPACDLHDFGYRNYGGRAGALALEPTAARKKVIDQRFLQEMRRICDQKRPDPIRNTACNGAARAFYDGVRLGGNHAFFG